MILIRTEITEKYEDLFEESPVPIYRIDYEDMDIQDRFYYKVRESFRGKGFTGKYVTEELFGPYIDVSSGLQKQVEKEIIKHEINHHEKHGDVEALEKYDYLQWLGTALVTAGVGGIFLKPEGSVLADSSLLAGFLAIVGSLIWRVYDILVVKEKEADENVEFQEAISKSDSISEIGGIQKLAYKSLVYSSAIVLAPPTVIQKIYRHISTNDFTDISKKGDEE